MVRRALFLVLVVCVGAIPSFSDVPLAADDWPQWMGKNRDDVWSEAGILEAFPADGPKILWRRPVHGGFSGPAVVGGLGRRVVWSHPAYAERCVFARNDQEIVCASLAAP